MSGTRVFVLRTPEQGQRCARQLTQGQIRQARASPQSGTASAPDGTQVLRKNVERAPPTQPGLLQAAHLLNSGQQRALVQL